MRLTSHSSIHLRVAEIPDPTSDVWFIHGFGESGLSFEEAFSSPLALTHNLYAPDLPGSGRTPARSDVRSVASAAGVVVSLAKDLSGVRPVVLVGHSLGSLIAVEAARLLGSQVVFLVSVEGNLTEKDTFLSSLARPDRDPEDFYADLKQKAADLEDDPEAIRRYLQSLRLADPETLWNLGQSGVAATGEKAGAESFLAATCDKIYYWGGDSLSEKSRGLVNGWPDFMKREFPGGGHWPMITRTQEFYTALAEDIGRRT